MLFERIRSSQEALTLFENEITQLNLKYHIKSFGNSPKTTSCILLDKDNNLLDIGNGKGIGIQSELSAKYEALEHYLGTKRSNLSEKYFISTSAEVFEKISSENKKIIPDIFQKEAMIDVKTAWTTLDGYLTNKKITLPLYCVNPDYSLAPYKHDELDYKKAISNPTNNGTAIGSTFEEALVHGINELIERDALSIFLLNTFVKKKPDKIKILKKSSADLQNKRIIDLIEHDLDEELLIVDITTDLAIPVFCVSFTKQPQSIQPTGFGASLNANYALERALLEALQSFHLYDNSLKIEDEAILKKFEEWSVFKKCAHFDLQSMIQSEKQEVTLPLPSSDFLSLDRILNTLASVITKNNLELFYGLHYQSKNGISCVKVCIPGLEEFHRVRYGSFEIPGERGRKALFTTTS